MREHDRTLWRLALLAGPLLPAYRDLDARRALILRLVHDLGEVYEGDVSAALQPDQDGKDRQERAAVERAATFLPAVSGREPRAVLDVQTQEKVRERQMR